MSTSSKERNKRRARKRLHAMHERCGAVWYDDPRRLKRQARRSGAIGGPVYDAYCEGEALAHFGPRGMPKRLWENPYPPGRRHDEWQRGFDNADPMGAWHGKNR